MLSMREATGGWSWLAGKIYGTLRRNSKSNRVVVQAADLGPDEQVLDIGCGAGKALVEAARIVGSQNCFGVDPTPSLAETARQRLPRAQVEVAMAEDLPFEDDRFDVVWAISSPHHWDDRHAGLREVARVLRPGGRFLLAEQRKRRPGGHGLTDDEAAATVREMAGIGFADLETLRLRVRWDTMLVVRGWAPQT